MKRGMTSSVARSPALWIEAVRALFAMSARGWWRRSPFVPTAHRPYVGWREATAYGSADGVVDAVDLRDYLRWRRAQRGLD